jgi:multidrug efflux pump subunit AcrA (membrane-fusion protein)
VVSHIAPSIDPETRSLRVRIEVKNNAALRPGMFVLVEIGGKANDENAESVLAVPQSAIQIVDGTTAVFVPVQDEANAFKLRPVSTGNCVDGQACILAGLKEGEHVVVAGSAILKADLLKASAKDED